MFAALHLYWGMGGSLGLAESAGADLAERRPSWFVAIGLFGVAALLVTAAVLGVLLSKAATTGGRRSLSLLGAAVGAVLLLRAVGLEVLLLADPRYGNGAVSPAERFWTLVLWNPWFLVGALTFGLAAGAGRRDRGSPSSVLARRGQGTAP
jgi:hypothetical protein